MNREELNEIIEKQLAKAIGEAIRHVDAGLAEQETKMGERFDRLETMVDAVAERVATDDQERAAIIAEQRRHRGWIGQLAEVSTTKLVPPLPE